MSRWPDVDLTESIAPRSDQVNADDLIAGPITYTVREVVNGKAEQPFDFLLVETDRAYRPSKTMRRVIVNAWGAETASYADFVANGGWKGVKEKGVMRQEGKDYVVQDGDVLLFRFNV